MNSERNSAVPNDNTPVTATRVDDDALLAYLEPELLSAMERDAMRAALVSDPALRGRLQSLQSQLSTLKQALRDTPEVELNPQVQQRWQLAIAREHARETHAARPPSWGWALAGAFACAALVFWRWPSPSLQPSLAEQSTADSAAGTLAGKRPQRVFTDYADDARARLMQWQHQPESMPDTEAQELLTHHVELERLATQRGQDDLARLLRAMRPLLQELAAPKPATAGDATRAALIAQLEFEYSYLLTKRAAPTSKQLSL